MLVRFVIVEQIDGQQDGQYWVSRDMGLLLSEFRGVIISMSQISNTLSIQCGKLQSHRGINCNVINRPTGV
jgi:hypothetical protein